jgi:hypothetical protein
MDTDRMNTMTQTQQTATWRSGARPVTAADLCTYVIDGRFDGNHGTKPRTSEVTFPAIRPTRRGAPPL